MNPLVSVVTPAYNAEKYISECIDSIQNQSYTHFEHIIVDDGSTDNTARIVQSYQDSRIKLISHDQNMGLAHARNTGIENANGEYIAWLDADDKSRSQRLEKQVTFMRENPLVGVLGSLVANLREERVAEKDIKPESHEEILASIVFRNPFAISSTLVKKTVYIDEAYVPKVDHTMTDYDLWCRIALKTRMHNLQEYLLEYRKHNDQMMAKITKEHFKDLYLESVSHLLKRIMTAYELKYSENHYLLHYANPDTITESDVKEVLLWLRKIVDSNNKEKVFPIDVFRKYAIDQANKFLHVVAQTKATYWKHYFMALAHPCFRYNLLQRLNYMRLSLKYSLK